MRSTSASTRRSNACPRESIGRGYRWLVCVSRRMASAGRDQGERRLDDGAGATQLQGVERVAAVRGAVGLEGAEVAQATRARFEVFAGARLGDGVVERGGAALHAADRLVGGR